MAAAGISSVMERLDDTLSVREGRDRYLAANGFTTDDYRKPWFHLKVLGKNVPLPNTSSRRRVVPLHDLHHVLTGYHTDWKGEGEIGAWELGAGCNTATLYVLNGSAALIGLALAPGRTWRAFVRGRSARSLYRERADYEGLLDLTVGALRERLGIRGAG
jgi:hypothetical protein